MTAPISQGVLFQRLRWRLVRNAGTQLFGNSRVRLVSMVLCSVLVCAAVFGVSLYGFGRLVEDQIPQIVLELLFNAMFVTLGGMLVFSTGLVLYAGLFTGAEAKFLLATPARADQVFATKFQSAVAFSSWAFVVLGGPILIAYGIQYWRPGTSTCSCPCSSSGSCCCPAARGPCSACCS